MEQNRKYITRPTHIWPIHFLKKVLGKFNRDGIICSTNGTETTECPYVKILNFMPYIKINSKCLIGLNVKSKVRNLLEGNKGKNYFCS